jgi:hypothetical protein
MFKISDKYINCKCGLHLVEYQHTRGGEKGIINSKEKFTKCCNRVHLTREEYNSIIPKIIDEFIKAGFYETIKHFDNTNNKNYFKNLIKDETDIDNITSQKTKKDNQFIRSYMPHIYETCDYNGINLKGQWTKSKLEHAFELLDKPNYTVNSYLSEILKRLKFNPVTIYPAIMTKTILNRYDCKSVFDPCIGWGGRMLGTTCLGGHYTGCEPYTKTYTGLNKMIDDLNLHDNTEIYNSGVEEILDELDDKYFDACITSPPYYNLEVYTDEDTQSIQKYKSYEEWLNNFMKPIIKYVCNHVEKVSCWSVKNIKTDSNYELLNDVIRLHEEYGWVLIDKYGVKKNLNSESVDGDITYIFVKI